MDGRTLASNFSKGSLLDVLGHNFSSFEIEHTKSPTNPKAMYALDLMSKVLKHLEVAFCVYMTIFVC